MENYNETPQQERSKVNPFLSTWMHPKQTARYMIDAKSIGYAILVMSIAYIGAMLTGLIDSNFLLDVSPWIIVLFCVILAPISAIIGTAFSTLIFWLVGKLFKGSATFSEMFKGLSLAGVPFIALIPFYLIWLFTSPESLMDANYMESAPWIFWPSILMTAVTSIWSMVITVGVVAEAHRFSNWKAFFTVLIPSIVGVVILFILLIIIFIGIIGISMI
ncbi:YIP1 family protein [Lysinibacillus sphaericus]|uniref:Yip1 family protein n=1 Tax=Lysinibacillus sphaericus TaxID=1421 RepID=UPI002162C8C5|nr:Yip1 family protein [Lysinibacillus sphaericus]MCS1382346.1 YIP1 family protein [Lysinibacillus sphaericus]